MSPGHLGAVGKLMPEWWRILHTGTLPLQTCLLPLQHLHRSSCTGHSNLQQSPPSLAVTAACVSCPCHRLSTLTHLPLWPPLSNQVPQRLMLVTPSPVPCSCTAKSCTLGLEERSCLGPEHHAWVGERRGGPRTHRARNEGQLQTSV